MLFQKLLTSASYHLGYWTGVFVVFPGPGPFVQQQVMETKEKEIHYAEPKSETINIKPLKD